MELFEVEDALKSFRILVDNREQNTPKAVERYAAFGVPYERATLKFGDYAGQIMLPGGRLYDTAKPVTARCVVERKMSLEELAACFTRERDRFRREFERAAEAGAKTYLLVENASYEAIVNHRYRSKFNPNAMLASLIAWSVRYDLTPVFCRAATSGKLIKEILYRDVKERLQRGEFG